MKNRKIIGVKAFILAVLALSVFIASAQVADYTPSTAGNYQTIGSSVNIQSYQPGTYSSLGWTSPSIYWPEFDMEMCKHRQDFIVQITPGGCEPAVVRSDLLEEQNAPVFCKLTLIQTNPLIDVSRVKTVRFPGALPKGVAGITYFPPRYNLMQTNDIADTPIDDNIGYFVVSLKKTPNEKDMPDWIEGNLTAIIDYDVESALGTGRANFYVSPVEEQDWLRDYKFYSFWNGKGYLKVESIESDQVRVSVYRDFNTREATQTIKKGATGDTIYLGGFYCAAGLKVKVESIDVPVEAALLQVGDDQTWVAKGDKIMDDKCTVESVTAGDAGGKVTINCPVTNGKFSLSLTYGKANLKINDEASFSEYGIGKEVVSGQNIYLAYSGTWKNGDQLKPVAVIVSDPWVNTEFAFQQREMFTVIDKVVTDKKNTGDSEALKTKIREAIVAEYNRKVLESKDKLTSANAASHILVLIDKGSNGDIIPIKLDNSQTQPTSYHLTLGETESLKNKEYKDEDPEFVYYKKAIQSYKDVADLYPDAKRLDDKYFEPYAAEALYNAAKLAQLFGRIEDRETFYSRLRADYPDSSWTTKAQNELDLMKKYETKESRAVVNLRDGSYFVSVLGFKGPTKDTLGVDLMINGKEERLGLNEIFQITKAEQTGTTTATKSGFIEGTPVDTLTFGNLYYPNQLPAGTSFTISGAEKVLNIELKDGAYYLKDGTSVVAHGSMGDVLKKQVIITKIKILVDDTTTDKYNSLFDASSIQRTPSSISTTTSTAGETLQVTKIEDDKVTIVYNPVTTRTTSGTTTTATTTTTGINTASQAKTEVLETDKKESVVFGTNTVRLLNIDIEKQAKLVLDSEVMGPRAYANFSFKIGIEKRGIKLSPEKTKEMIDNIDESMKKWEQINETLWKVVKGLKSACFATSAILVAKNAVTGFSGGAMARSELMTMPEGWNDYCEKLVNEGKYYNLQACLLDKNSEIEGDVKAYAGAIQKTNEKLTQARSGITERTDILDIEGQVTDQKKMEENFRNSINCDLMTSDVDCSKISFDATKESYTLNNALNAGGSAVYQEAIFNKLNATETEAVARYNEDAARSKAAEKVKQLGMKLTYLDGDAKTMANIYQVKDKDIINGKNPNIKAGTSLVAVMVPKGFSKPGGVDKGGYNIDTLGGKPIFVEVQDSDQDGTYTRTAGDTGTKVYDENGNVINGQKEQGKSQLAAITAYLNQNKATKFVKTDAKAYENKISNPERLTVKYFERAPYKGLPAEVPFDIANGWYVEMEYVLSGFGKPYDESGRVANFYICNVGANGNIEFKRNADDICRYYNGISDELGFPGLDATQSRNLVARAKNAITEASKYYGKKEAYINGQKFGTGMSFSGSGGRCTDFMSARDCNIMFNVCDPVICPASRCDLGGTFPVDNVIQTGIIGSLVLCLPNIKEGIYIPVCLSGVRAGIEGYLSILKSHRDCLNESLATGRTIGICDEIQSIYLCEFFWRQMVPFFDVLVPRLIESFMGQGARGGGEYLTVQSAWDNTQNSIHYFTNEYAVNSMEAFQARSTEQVGSDICQSFVSTKYPTDFNLLTEPDSPVQYHAWFDENVLTTATPYPTSHYKVYYHIYAGTDQGAYYEVYLTDIAEEFTTRYTYQSTYFVVPEATGYLPAGETVDVAKDFTAPSGYKKLCVRINGKDECDFGKVSTSYAVNYISDQYATEQAKENIATSKECVAGTPSLYSMVQPNAQAGAEEVVNPELYNQGIVRVCSTYNPGRQVTSKGDYDTTNSTFDRWKDVGYCDDKTLRCWLDTESVQDVIKDKNLEKQVLSEVDTSVIGNMDKITYEGAKETSLDGDSMITNALNGLDFSKKEKVEDKEAQIKAIDKAIKETEDKFKQLAELSPSNPYRARGWLLLGKLYEDIAKELKGEEPTPPATNPTIESQKVEVKQADNNYEIGAQVTSDKDGTIWVKKGVDYWVREDGQTAVFDKILPVTSFIGPINQVTSTSGTAAGTGTTTTVWTDSMLKDDIPISMNWGWLNTYRSYKYVNGADGGWVLDTGDDDPVGVVGTTAYVDGIKKIVSKTFSLFNGYIIIGTDTSSITIEKGDFKSSEAMAEKVFQELKRLKDASTSSGTAEFTLDADEIKYNGIDTQFRLEKMGDRYAIKEYKSGTVGDVGYIGSDGAITIYPSYSTNTYASALKGYIFSASERTFAKKS